MQSGFLTKEAQAKKFAKPEVPHGPKPADRGRQPAAGVVWPQAAPPAPSPEQLEKGLSECMSLLQGPTDERRFVGLLLVTKLLPQGDAETVKRVFDAVGFPFLARLLLPLRSGAPSEAVLVGADAEALQRHVGTSALGLAVLASAARVPELAGSEELLSLVPLFLKVASAGGVTQVVAATSGAVVAPDPATDSAAGVDALECSLAVARSGKEGRSVVLESGAIGAMAAALRHAAGDVPTSHLAVHLLALLLGGGERAAVVTEYEGDVLALVPLLARLLLLGRADGEEAQAAAALQLDALHVLLLVLPPPQQAERLAAGLAASAARGEAWPAEVRAGLSLLLRSRAGAVQRQSALQLAAAVTDLAGPEWLLGPGADPAALSGGAAAGGAGPSFFPLVVEMAKVETSVLLLDALAPAAPVPRGAAPGTPASSWVAPEPRSQPLESSGEEGEEGSAGESMDADQAPPGLEGAGSGGGAGAEPPLELDALRRVLESDGEAKAMEAHMRKQQAHLTKQHSIHEHEAEPSGSRGQGASGSGSGSGGLAPEQQPPPYVGMVDRVEKVQVPTEMRWEGPSEPAGDRASALLPACFSLLESCIEALALDTEASEGMMESVAAPAFALDAAAAHRALASLQEGVEVVLQFVEQAAAAPGAGRRPLVLAAVRLIARFSADLPEAFGPRLRALLPFLLSVRSTPEPSLDEAASGTAALPEGVCFLLPTLLQLTEPEWGAGRGEEGRAEQQAWLECLAQPPALLHLVDYTRHAARRCSKSVTETAAADCDSGLLFACALLLQVLAPQGQAWMSAAAALERGPAAEGEGAPSLGPVTHAALLVVPSLLEVVASRPVVPPADASPQQRGSYVRLLSGAATLCALIVAAVARQLRGSVQPGGALGPLPAESVRQASKLVLAGLQATCLALQLPGTAVPLAAAATLADLDPKELREHLELLTASALPLLEVSPVFAGECQASAWVQAALRTGAAEPAAGVGEASRAMEGLALFFGAARALQQQP